MRDGLGIDEHEVRTRAGRKAISIETAAARAFGTLLPPVPLYAAATAMAFSRLYLGVHYPSDIAAGAVLGTVLGSFGR